MTPANQLPTIDAPNCAMRDAVMTCEAAKNVKGSLPSAAGVGLSIAEETHRQRAANDAFGATVNVDGN